MNSIEEILAELYAIDPGFKKHEANLRSLVKRLQLAKPNFSIDDAFVRRLRTDILQAGKPKPVSFLIRSYFVGAGKALFQSSAFGVALAMVLLVPLSYGAQLYREGKLLATYHVENASVSLGQQQEIAYKPQNAFGSVALRSIVVTATSTATSSDSEIVADIAASSTPAETYLFTGTSTSLVAPSANVLKTDTGTEARNSFLVHIQTLGFELADLTSVASGNNTLGTVQVQESKPLGYIVTMDLNHMVLTISKNPKVWPDANLLPALSPMNATDTVATALAFLKQHNIDTSNYAPGLLLSDDTASSTSTVLLPLLINQEPIYNIDGSQYGIIVVIDQITGKVIEVNNVTLQRYTASPYPTETDFNNILNSINATTSATTTLPTLNTPTAGLIRYVTDNGEFFVPGLVFQASTGNLVTASLLKDDTIGE